jgi:UDP-N-acetylmuramoyl-L-alanyl-D-glutamate--2,6-diaminopimelate ligase
MEPSPALQNLEIRGLSADSRKIGPGDLFAALPGTVSDGRRFINDAVAQGAVAVLTPPGTTLKDYGRPLAQLVDENPRRRLALMAARFYGRQPKTIAAVTGTNGKTSVAEFTRQIWQAEGLKAASLGTLGLVPAQPGAPASLTTPDPVDLHRCLAALAGEGFDHLAMEASSHGLDWRSAPPPSPTCHAITWTTTATRRPISPPSDVSSPSWWHPAAAPC